MRNFTKLKKKRIKERVGIDHFLQLWFNYHFLFFRSLISRGLKLRAFNFFLKIKKGIKLREKFDPSFLFLIAMLKITPLLILKDVKMGGATYAIPFPINSLKKISYGCRWVIKLLKDTNRVFSTSAIIDTLVLSFYDEGLSIKKKKEVYNIAELNRHLIKNKVFKK